MEPAPWTPEGLERIQKLGLAVQVCLSVCYTCACPVSRCENKTRNTDAIYFPFLNKAVHLVLMSLPRVSAVSTRLLGSHG